jgi:SAM-dependent methyltransferase
MAMLADDLFELWERVEAKEISSADFDLEKDRRLLEYRKLWEQALILENQPDLETSLLREISLYLGDDNLEAIRKRCQGAKKALNAEWRENVNLDLPDTVTQFYDRSSVYLHSLMWWHTLQDDISPLAYVTALDFAKRNGCGSHLDFGAGVGSGGILFARHGFSVALADISSIMQRFCRWRAEIRKLPIRFFDLKTEALPGKVFDLITAMDVFEHLLDPVGTVDLLDQALKPGGFLFGRFFAEKDEKFPEHTVHSFKPVFNRLAELGYVKVWADRWLWGHDVFQKP